MPIIFKRAYMIHRWNPNRYYFSGIELKPRNNDNQELISVSQSLQN